MSDEAQKEFNEIIRRYLTLDRVMPTKLVFSEKLISDVKKTMEAVQAEALCLNIIQRNYDKTPDGTLIGWDLNGPIYKGKQNENNNNTATDTKLATRKAADNPSSESD